MKQSPDPVFENEYPLPAPWEFEGFTEPADALAMLRASLELPDAKTATALAVIREGENAHGLWGYLFVREEGDWVHRGYTLEPRTSSGKGPIPLGDYRFSRWTSARLGKCLRLHNVPGFTDILVHVGNAQGETRGCILAARRVDRPQEPTRLLESRLLTDWLHQHHAEGLVLVRSR